MDASRRRQRIADRTATITIRLGGALVVVMVCFIVLDIARQAAPLFLPASFSAPASTTLHETPMAVGCPSEDRPCWALTTSGQLELTADTARPTAQLPTNGGIAAAHSDTSGLVAAVSRAGTLHTGRVTLPPRQPARWQPVAPPLPLAATGWVGVSAAGDAEGNVTAVLWKRSAGSILAHWRAPDGPWKVIELDGTNVLATAAVARDLRRAALISGGELTILSLEEASVVDRYQPQPRRDTAVVSFLASGGTLATADVDGEITILVAVPTLEIVNRSDRLQRVLDLDVPAGAMLVVREHDRLGERALDRGLEVASILPRLHPVRSSGSVRGMPTAIAGFAGERSFLLGSDSGDVALFHATSGRRLHHQRWSANRTAISALTTSLKGDSTLAVCGAELIRREVHNPHPEVSWRTLFLPVWYEGYPSPAIVWQSTGGSEAFEPKLSLTPLLFGTLKAAAYALILALPLALLAAVYTAQLAPRWLAQVIKPLFELMAAVPSVVIGFVAGLWLAPILERNLLATLLLIGSWPLMVVLGVAGWRLLPGTLRRRLPSGSELGALIVATAAVGTGALVASPFLESRLFAGDLPRYLFTELGLRYDQSNALVAGIALGFAVIPVIFTIAEDACSAVPNVHLNAARALGATRWQTTRHLVLPAAAPGLVAAVVLGLGRAFGETMIVLMATGNTPIMDLSPFDGMRTLSAAIAVEILEAPVGGTLFRVLFLAGFLLFLLTLVVTTIADLVSESVRRRYGSF